MLLAVDIGNTHTVTGLFDGQELIGHWQVRSEANITPDELALQQRGLYRLADVETADIRGCIVSSVVPVLENTWVNYISSYLAHFLHTPFITVDPTSDWGISISIRTPREVGADRIVNAAAAWDRFKAPVIVIDFGTAITFDCIDEPGDYLGGAILPGIGISLDALSSRTAKLPRIDVSKPPEKIIGYDTVTAIHSGVLHGYGGMIDRLCSLLGSEMSNRKTGTRPAVVATGGMAGVVAPYCTSIESVDPLLTLRGLRLLYDRPPN